MTVGDRLKIQIFRAKTTFLHMREVEIYGKYNKDVKAGTSHLFMSIILAYLFIFKLLYYYNFFGRTVLTCIENRN